MAQVTLCAFSLKGAALPVDFRAESTFALFVLQAAIKDRKSLVDTHRTRWGDDWIILPNPAYGEWTRPLGRGNDDLNRLAPELK